MINPQSELSSKQTISYAQNLEDIVLLRTLSHVQHGFYVDVGAWHPTNESVTKVFYDRGWSGINIEPQPSLIEAFIEQRPRDTNLQLAVSNQPGLISLWVPRYSALATCDKNLLDSSIPDYSNPKEYVVEAQRLDSLLYEHAHSKDIHFMKIDVEGFESKVICSINFKKYRPVVMVIEATSPHDNTPTWHSWEPQLLSYGYIFALYDGLNRFYVREEDSRDLLTSLSIPANCLDGFITSREFSIQNELNKTKTKLETITTSQTP